MAKYIWCSLLIAIIITSMFKLTKRRVQITLGILWLLDGALQLQHQMFSSAFATQVIDPAIQGQPRFVSGPMNFGVHLFLHSPIVFNALFALTQLGIGALILWKRTIKWGLLASVGWGLIVWIFGEGYGGIFSGHTLLLMGAPGAVIIYVLLALAVMPSKNEDKKDHKKQPIAYWLVFVWLVLWVGGGVYQMLPGQNTASDVSSMISGMADGAPSWMASLDNHTANVINGFGGKSKKITTCTSGSSMNMTSAQMAHMSNQSCTSTQSDPGYWFILLMTVLQIGIGFSVLFSGIWRKLAISLGIVLSLAFWVVGQSMGAYFTGLATDLNAGPLFVLLGLAILGCTDLDKKLSRLGYKIETVMIGKPNNSHQSEIIQSHDRTVRTGK
jgi:hypothetical protein